MNNTQQKEPEGGKPSPDNEVNTSTSGISGFSLSTLITQLREQGFKGVLNQYGRHMLFIALVLVGIWIARLGIQSMPTENPATPTGETISSPSAAAPTLAETGEIGIEDLPAFEAESKAAGGVIRLANVHTIFPTRERMEIIKYEVQKGDSLYGIAEKFGVKPHTILWGNFEELEGNVHALSPGQELNILPVDGVLHIWKEGETISGIANAYGVAVEEIVDWPGNNIDPSIDPDIAEIPAGMALVVPGGTGEVVDMTGGQITRSNPAVASILGPGACPTVYDGPVGTGTFIYPTVERYLSGYDYDPVLHPALDFAGSEGNAIYASDTGVIVYAGWNNWGYGNVVVIDHGNGWQTLYAHMAYIPGSIYCGLGVYQGAVIGPLGNTGNSSGAHLHFEMRHESYGKVNPWNFLP